MARLRHQLADRVPPQPVAQTVDQGRQVARLVEIAAGQAPPGERLGQQRLDHVGAEDRALDAEARVDLRELLGEQALQLAAVAARPAGADVRAGRAVVDPVEGEVEAARAEAAGLEPARAGRAAAR